jgi:hypothetical protein
MAGDPVNNETGVLADGRTDAQRPFDSPAAGGTAQSTTYHRSGTPGAPATAQGGAGDSDATPLHTQGGNAGHTGAPAEVDTGGATMPGVYASGMPIWTETLEAVNALPERIVNFIREAELTRLGGPSSDPQPGAEVDQNPDGPNQTKLATSPSATPGMGDTRVHWWFRPFGGGSA